MMNKNIFSKFRVRTVGVVVALVAIASVGGVAYASHSWGGYHWARTTSSFTLKLGDNVSSAWDAYLRTTSTDWSTSMVLDTTVVSGSGGRNCSAKSGMVQVCNSKYGNNGWLGLAQIWISGSHITQGVAKMNDTYFNLTKYNTPAWRNFVMCQEVGHTFGLGHNDEIFDNENKGTCMDYTNDPSTNQHPNTHDHEQLVAIYGSHTDGSTTLSTRKAGASALAQNGDFKNASDWGKEISKDSRGHSSLYERNLGGGDKVFTFVIWVE